MQRRSLTARGRFVCLVAPCSIVLGLAAAASAAESGRAQVATITMKATTGAAIETLGRIAAEPQVPFEANPSDPLGMDALFDEGKPDQIDMSALDPSDWIPEHARARSLPAATMPAPSVAPTKAVHDQEKGLDPEPDAAIKPVTSAPSKDPLDKPRPAAAPASAPAQAPNAVPPSEAALPPLNDAIKAAIDKREATPITGPHAAEQRKEREAVAFFYAAHGFAPAWSDAGKPVPAVSSIIARLALAGEDALTLVSAPKDLLATGTPEAVAASDLALTDAVVAYARQATGSRVDPASISPLIGARPELADPAEVIDSLVGAGTDAGDKLQALNPSDPRYVALRTKLNEMRAARVPSVERIPAGPTLRIGMRDPRVPLIRSRFSLAPSEGETDDLAYDTEVAAAVADFQRENGLPPSGVLTKRTIAALSGGEPSQLEAALVANMEIWRWMPHELGHDRIEVNVPQYVVTVYHDGTPVATNRVVVGKTATPTPLFSNTMKYLIVNPVWNVPVSIIKKEFLPKSGGDPSYMAAHGFDVSYRNGQLVVKQPAGAKNALGRIKFMFPNDYSVYLHDTPSKSLFAASKRAFSHGCVRVDRPFAFAESVLNDGVPEGGKIVWTEKRLQKMLGDKERYVNLPEPLPIHIEYFTASVDAESGHLQLYEDVYDYARRVAAALGRS